MKPWNQISHYAGFDWAREHHDVVIVDGQGQIVADFRLPHSAQGWQEFGDQIKKYPAVAVAIETSQGAAIDQLLRADCTVYPVNPHSARSYRQRKAPSGNKTDRLDAWSLAEALRMDDAQRFGNLGGGHLTAGAQTHGQQTLLVGHVLTSGQGVDDGLGSIRFIEMKSFRHGPTVTPQLK